MTSMPPIEVSYQGFGMIGTTLLVLAATIAVYLLHHQSAARVQSSMQLAGFFGSVAASGMATILGSTFKFWGRLFDPWQDTLVILGGFALVQFAYAFPNSDQPREARWVRRLAGALFIIALGYALVFDYTFVFRYTPGLGVANVFYWLFPAGTLLNVIVFFRRAVHYSRQHWATASQSGSGTTQSHRTSIWHWFHPQGRDAKAHTGFALGLILGFLPGLAIALDVPAPYDFLMLNVGSLLALAVIGLVYFNVTPAMTSFMAKLVGITLLALLIMLSVIGTFSYRAINRSYNDAQRDRVILAFAAVKSGFLSRLPDDIVYVVAWRTDAPDNPAGYRSMYVRANPEDFTLQKLISQNQQPADARKEIVPSAQRVEGYVPQLTNRAWYAVTRYGRYPAQSSHFDYIGWITTEGNLTYEIGLSERIKASYLSDVAFHWTLVILGCGLIVIFLFPFFFRQTLVIPLRRLLDGIANMKQRGSLEAVPIQYHDEIGLLTDSFNTLAHNLSESYAVLEQRVADRTRELSAFSDLTLLRTESNDLATLIKPALQRILDAVNCHALVVHVVTDDHRSLELVCELGLSAHAKMLAVVPLDATFQVNVLRNDQVILCEDLEKDTSQVMRLPAAFKVAGSSAYLGIPLTADGVSLGWLSCYRKPQHSFEQSKIAFLMAMARQLGVIVENHRLRQRIGQIAAIEERQRLARDLHDSVAQLLYSVTLFADAVRRAATEQDQPRLNQNIDQMEATAIQAFREMRSLLYELQPLVLDNKGLAQVVRDRLEAVEQRIGIEVEYEVDPNFDVQNTLARELYYVLIEALNNSLRHAAATRLTLKFHQSDTNIDIQIKDNGRGFEFQKPSKGLGLKNMQLRIEQMHGTIDLYSEVNRGTVVHLCIPIAPREKNLGNHQLLKDG